MKFTGTLVITDPCYFEAKPLIESPTLYGDWSCMVYPGTPDNNTDHIEWDNYYLRFFHDYNFEEHTQEEKAELLDEYTTFKENWKKEHILGEFCADAGEVGVFNYDDLTDEDKKFCKEHYWCAAIIEDFDGDVDIVEFILEDDDEPQVRVVGTGNKPFFSVQSGF